MTGSFDVDVAKGSVTISPRWFAHNLEHTRSCIWHGLSAELLYNRKFVGTAGRSGVAEHWHPIGQPAAWHVLEIFGGEHGTHAETYTGHFDASGVSAGKGSGGMRFAGQRQRIESPRPGVRAGIGQGGLVMIGGRSYEVRAALRSDRPLTAVIAVTSGDQHEERVKVGPEGWTESAFTFNVRETSRDARFEITFEGPGNLYVGAVSLMPAGHFLGMRRDVIERLREIGSPMLRWPGGNFAGDYLWRDGLLPVDKRAPLQCIQALAHTNFYDTHELGTDEFIALCRELGAEPFLTINMSLEGAEEAAAWVEYCNGPADSGWGRLRAERGHPEPYGVRYWTLGNEMGYDHMKGSHDPREYSKFAAACAKAMRKVDPSVELVASCAWTTEWYEGLLASKEDYFDHISFHVYHPPVEGFSTDGGRSDFRRLADTPANMFRGTGYVDGKQKSRLSLKDIRGLINAKPRGGKDIGIAFDEWNVWYAWHRTPGISEGIYAALMVHCLCRESANVGLSLGAFFEPVNEGAILVTAEAARLTTMGHVMNLFKQHQGGRLVSVDQQAANEDIDLVVSVRADELTVTIINRSPEEDGEVKIGLRNAGTLADIKGVMLTSPDILPGTEFSQVSAEVKEDPGSLGLMVPKHSVARITARLRGA